MRGRANRLEFDQFEERARQEQEGSETDWQDWVGPLIGAGASIAQGFKPDPNAQRKQALYGQGDGTKGGTGEGWSGALPGGEQGHSGAYRYNTGAMDEADYLHSGAIDPSLTRQTALSGDSLTNALDENDERTKAALFGTKRRMSPYDF
jgi:hypothetical protein